MDTSSVSLYKVKCEVNNYTKNVAPQNVHRDIRQDRQFKKYKGYKRNKMG